MPLISRYICGLYVLPQKVSYPLLALALALSLALLMKRMPQARRVEMVLLVPKLVRLKKRKNGEDINYIFIF